MPLNNLVERQAVSVLVRFRLQRLELLLCSLRLVPAPTGGAAAERRAGAANPGRVASPAAWPIPDGAA